ncbi:MAG: hypothetical protein R3F61_04345 [Myxococcota bacterium]
MGYPSVFEALAGRSHYLWVPAPPRVVSMRLSEHPNLLGMVEDDHFHCTFQKSGRNSWRPSLKGTLTEANGGTLIEVSYPMSVFVLLFTLVHGMFLFGISWLMGLGAYWMDLKHARAVMLEASGATLENEEAQAHANGGEVADPTSAGADSAAPFSFQARSSMDAVTFSLKGVHGSRTALKVSSAGIEARRGDDAELVVDWNDLLRVDLYETTPGDPGIELLLETTDGPKYVPIGGHPADDQLWMATYLGARNERWSDDEAQRAHTEAERQRLAAVRQSQTRRES